MSMDRGFHGGPAKPAGPLNPNLEFNRYRSMDDLGGSKDPKNSGFELVRLLRVCRITEPEMDNKLFFVVKYLKS